MILKFSRPTKRFLGAIMSHLKKLK